MRKDSDQNIKISAVEVEDDNLLDEYPRMTKEKKRSITPIPVSDPIIE